MLAAKPYLLALAVGLLVGALYALVNVLSPAPPVVALVGLLGILLGEQIPPLAKRLLAGQAVDAAALRATCGAHVLGPLPGRPDLPNAEPRA
jgi:XapX domain-containing protein